MNSAQRTISRMLVNEYLLFSYCLSERQFSCSIHPFLVLYSALSRYHVMMTMTALQFSMICDISEYLIFFFLVLDYIL